MGIVFVRIVKQSMILTNSAIQKCIETRPAAELAEQLTQVFYNEDYPHAYEEDSNHFSSRFVVVLELVKIIITNTFV